MQALVLTCIALHQSVCQDVVICTCIDLSVSARQGYIFTVFKSQVRSLFLSVGSEQIQGYVLYVFVCNFLIKLAQRSRSNA